MQTENKILTNYKTGTLSNIFYNINIWFGRKIFERKFVSILLLLAIILVISTYFAFTNSNFFDSGSRYVILLLNLDLGVLLLLGLMIARRLVKLWIGRRKGLAGSKLHVKIVGIFSFLTILPTITLAIFSSIFFNSGVQSWFSERVRTALDQSSFIAEAYFEEHKKVISANVWAMAKDINTEFKFLISNPDLFNKFVDQQAEIRSLDEAIVFDNASHVWARSKLTFALEFERVTDSDLSNASEKVVILTSERRDKVRALVKINPNMNIYLLVGRSVDPKVLNRVAQTENAVSEYNQLKHRLSELEIRFALIFIVISLLLLMIAVWFGLGYSTQLANPISKLIDATEKLRLGNFKVKVNEGGSNKDLNLLTRAFNRMTGQIKTQQDKLVEANVKLDRRRQFIETVLSGVSAGVIGLDNKLRINILNSSASELLSLDIKNVLGKNLSSIIPEMAVLFDNIVETNNFFQTQLKLTQKGSSRVLLVKISTEIEKNKLHGYVITFDDITKLVLVQRQAAWADIARHMAHEIKNPLTPIQLSAERLKRRYINQIHSDSNTFNECVDTIVRQVQHIGQMVSEFSEFARMPKPLMELRDIVELCRQSLVLNREAYPNIIFKLLSDKDKIMFPCDARQIEQVLSNLIKNSIDSLKNSESDDNFINLYIKLEKKHLYIIIEDNGIGLPKEDKDLLTEPYFTKKANGTGLGLAIVKKIIEDHGGFINFEDRIGGGAIIKLGFYLSN